MLEKQPGPNRDNAENFESGAIEGFATPVDLDVSIMPLDPGELLGEVGRAMDLYHGLQLVLSINSFDILSNMQDNA